MVNILQLVANTPHSCHKNLNPKSSIKARHRNSKKAFFYLMGNYALTHRSASSIPHNSPLQGIKFLLIRGAHLIYKGKLQIVA